MGGAGGDNVSIKGKMVGLISATRTLMRSECDFECCPGGAGAICDGMDADDSTADCAEYCHVRRGTGGYD